MLLDLAELTESCRVLALPVKVPGCTCYRAHSARAPPEVRWMQSRDDRGAIITGYR